MNNQELTRREEAIYIVASLGYRMTTIDNALELVNENKFQDLLNFLQELDCYNIDNATCAKVSLVGVCPSMKFKDADSEEIEELMKKCNVNF